MLVQSDASLTIGTGGKRNVPALNLNLVGKQGKRQDTLGNRSLVSHPSSSALQSKPPKASTKGVGKAAAGAESRKSNLK